MTPESSIGSIGASLRSANLDVSKHLWEVVSFGAQAEMVENVFLHGVQVGIFHLDMLPASESSTEYCLKREREKQPIYKQSVNKRSCLTPNTYLM